MFSSWKQMFNLKELWKELKLRYIGDVKIDKPNDGDVLTYDKTNNQWINALGGGGGSQEVFIYANMGLFPGVGNNQHLYIATDTAKAYHYQSPTGYIEVSPDRDIEFANIAGMLSWRYVGDISWIPIDGTEAFNYRGTWDNSATYYPGDVVRWHDGGDITSDYTVLYRATVENTNDEPPTMGIWIVVHPGLQQADWNQGTATAANFIKNKPTDLQRYQKCTAQELNGELSFSTVVGGIVYAELTSIDVNAVNTITGLNGVAILYLYNNAGDDVQFVAGANIKLVSSGYLQVGELIAFVFPVDASPLCYEIAVPSSGISNDAYNASAWDADPTHAPSRNAVRDKIEAMISNTAYSNSWDNVTDVAPSKDAIYELVNLLQAEIGSYGHSDLSIIPSSYGISNDDTWEMVTSQTVGSGIKILISAIVLMTNNSGSNGMAGHIKVSYGAGGSAYQDLAYATGEIQNSDTGLLTLCIPMFRFEMPDEGQIQLWARRKNGDKVLDTDPIDGITGTRLTILTTP